MCQSSAIPNGILWRIVPANLTLCQPRPAGEPTQSRFPGPLAPHIAPLTSPQPETAFIPTCCLPFELFLVSAANVGLVQSKYKRLSHLPGSRTTWDASRRVSALIVTLLQGRLLGCQPPARRRFATETAHRNHPFASPPTALLSMRGWHLLPIRSSRHLHRISFKTTCPSKHSFSSAVLGCSILFLNSRCMR